jgi:NADH dehydrogenase FAD-containing subunit
VERHGVQFVRGAVERIEEARVIVHGEPLPFDHLVLALGARTAPRSGSGPL